MSLLIFSQDLILEQICSHLSLNDSNNLRKALGRKCFDFSFACFDFLKQITSIPYLDSKTFTTATQIQEFGSLWTTHQAIKYNDIDSLHYLLKWGSNPNRLYEYTKTVLCRAVKHNRFEMVQLLIDYGAIIDHAADDSALLWAIEHQRFDIFKYLVEHGADCNREYDDINVLCSAVASGSYPIVQYLIENGFDVNEPNDIQESPLMIAAKYDYSKIIRLLCETGANVNYVGNRGNTAFIYATRKDFCESAQILYEFGANMEIMNNFRLSGIDYAIDWSRPSQCIQWLNSIGYDLQSILQKERAQKNSLRVIRLENILEIKN